jgi:HEPN domain-containing protein
MSVKQIIVIDCPQCTVRVKSEATTWVGDGHDRAYFLVECPSCHHALFGSTFSFLDEYGNWVWDTAERLWPAPTVADLGPSIPAAARRDVNAAQKCFSHGIYPAAAVMCGRALERLIKEKTGKPQMLAKGLEALKHQGVIDERLHAWAEALRVERNIGAHASDTDTTKEDAQDIIDFTVAIFDYVYTLAEKYEKYVLRKKPRQ